MKCCKNETIRDYISSLGQPALCSETNLRAGGEGKRGEKEGEVREKSEDDRASRYNTKVLT